MPNLVGYDYDGDEWLPDGASWTAEYDDLLALAAKAFLNTDEAWGEVLQEVRS